jgi:hypothetical protein
MRLARVCGAVLVAAALSSCSSDELPRAISGGVSWPTASIAGSPAIHGDAARAVRYAEEACGTWWPAVSGESAASSQPPRESFSRIQHARDAAFRAAALDPSWLALGRAYAALEDVWALTVRLLDVPQESIVQMARDLGFGQKTEAANAAEPTIGVECARAGALAGRR